jgi:hypothetical protein
VLAARLDGYDAADVAITSLPFAGDDWLRQRLADARGAAGPAVWDAARDEGSRLDRKGFLAVLSLADELAAADASGP